MLADVRDGLRELDVTRVGLRVSMTNTYNVPGGRSSHSLIQASLANIYHWLTSIGGRAGVLMTPILPCANLHVLAWLDWHKQAIYADPALGRIAKKMLRHKQSGNTAVSADFGC